MRRLGDLPAAGEDRPHDVAVDEGNSPVADDLFPLVPFTGNEDAVSGLGAFERPADGFAPIGFDDRRMVRSDCSRKRFRE